ncbi:hypothetical protein C2W62_08955 [Candidatus Entotheonella serta]|nr:hypothetical protein C2W62_08955 [Candidatus Entotheonella serta]
MQAEGTKNRFRIAFTQSLRLLFAFVLLTGCESSTDETRPLTIETDAELPLIGIDQSAQLQAIVSTNDRQTIVTGEVPWDSSDESVIVVSMSGLATSTGIGSARVSTRFEEAQTSIELVVVPPYFLPLSPGIYEMSQGFRGSFSHRGTFTYSYDFIMSIGTLLVASRAGTIYAVEDRFPNGTGQFIHTNFVVVDHHDGTFTRYLHLTRRGALVEVGDWVEVGEPIGLSGNSGFSGGPHLHFDVTIDCGVPLDVCQTIEFWLANGPARRLTSGTIVQLEE